MRSIFVSQKKADFCSGIANRILVYLVISTMALVLAACGGDSGGDSGGDAAATPEPPPPPPGGGTATLQSIAVSPETVSLALGASQALSVTGTFSDGTSSPITSGLTWASDDLATAPVTPIGFTTGGTVGTATVTATHTATGFTGTSVVTVAQPAAATYWKTNEITVSAGTFSAAILSVTVPVSSAIGVVLQGTNTNFKVIDHGEFLLSGGNPVFITDPNNANVPLSFNFFDSDGDGVNDDLGLLFDNETTALFFPNDGSAQTLPSGIYKFPLASFNAAGTAFESDTLQPYVFYKTVSILKAVLKLNVWVVSGVGGLTTQVDAAADAEILGAIAKLRAAFESNPNVDITLDVTVGLVASTPFAVVDTQGEWDSLNSGFPISPAHDAMNIFIVSRMDFVPAGAIGIAARIPGPFNRQGTIQSGTLAEYQGDGIGTALGQILAHEFGHFLGLYHTSQTNTAQDGIIGFDPVSDTAVCKTADITSGGSVLGCPDVHNLMFPILADSTAAVTANQARVIRLNPGVSSP